MAAFRPFGDACQHLYVVYGDSGYLCAGKRDDAVSRNKPGHKIKYKINRRSSQVKKLSKSGQYAAKRAEYAKSSVRAKVEHVCVFSSSSKRLCFNGNDLNFAQDLLGQFFHRHAGAGGLAGEVFAIHAVKSGKVSHVGQEARDQSPARWQPEWPECSCRTVPPAPQW